MLDVALRVTVVVFMLGSLGGVGLGLAARELTVPLKHASFVALSLFGCWVACPVLAVLLLQLVPLDSGYAMGLLLLALAPCAPFAPAMAQMARGDPPYMAGFVLLSAASTVLMMPILTPMLVPGLSPDPFAVARPLLLFVLLPLLIGMAVRAWSRATADRVRPVVAVITSVAAAMLLLVTVLLHGRSVLGAVGSFAIATQVVFVVLATAMAYLLGWRFPHEQRSVLTLGLCTRNLGGALAPLAAIDHDPRAMVMIVIAVPVTIGVSFVTARWLARREQQRHASPPTRSAIHTPAGSA